MPGVKKAWGRSFCFCPLVMFGQGDRYKRTVPMFRFHLSCVRNWMNPSISSFSAKRAR